jgi:hypothetical protein
MSAPTNVFVLSTGRCGSMTFAKACCHIDNFTAAHESRMNRVGPERLAYPPGHIELDNRLSWLTGRLARRFPDEETFYVHLRRDREATARSFLDRWGKGIIQAYARGILAGAHAREDPMEVCLDYCRTVNANIEEFLSTRPNSMTVRLEEIDEAFPRFWKRIEAVGDLEAAMDEWAVRHNETPWTKRIRR